VNIYDKTSLIQCSLEELFQFHLDVKNLKAITPPNIQVTLLNEGFEPKEGAVLKLKTIKNFLPVVWEVKIDKLEAPNLLVDVAMKSPFRSWKHAHVFTQVDDRTCQLRDTIEYSLGFCLLDSLLKPFVNYQLESMFSYRHKVTKSLLELT